MLKLTSKKAEGLWGASRSYFISKIKLKNKILLKLTFKKVPRGSEKTCFFQLLNEKAGGIGSKSLSRRIGPSTCMAGPCCQDPEPRGVKGVKV